MKRILTAVFALTLIILLVGCDSDICKHDWERTENYNEYTAMDKCSICGVTRMYTDSDSISHSGTEAGVKMLRYRWDGYGIAYKEIYTCDLGYAIIECLSGLQETGEGIPEISDDIVDESTGELPITPGMVWLECGSVGLFRLNPAMNEICKVQTHLGEGKVLQMTETLAELLRQAWYYYPNDFWAGEYENGAVFLRQVYKMDSAVEWVSIDGIHIENKIDSHNNTISLRILASESKKVSICLRSYQSDDNLGSDDVKEIELVKGRETKVDFTFFGFYNYPYWVSVTVDNTKIDLTIDPTNVN